ncbi:MAG: M13 family metallopeptidase [Methylotenera sp.]|nr:M13 family metallopeptidase [Oligoflexia bacterium]
MQCGKPSRRLYSLQPMRYFLRMISFNRFTLFHLISTAATVALMFSPTAIQTSFASGVPDILDQSALKNQIQPCDNFYQFACGTWIDQTEIPADKNSVYHQSTALSDQTDVVLNGILKAYADGSFKLSASASKKLGDYYASCVQREQSTARAESALTLRLHEIDAIQDQAGLARAVARLHLSGTNALFSFGSGQDFNDSTQVVGMATQGGLGLPDKDYYLKQDAKSLEIVQKYTAHIAAILELSGSSKDSALLSAKSTVDFETQLASHAMSLDDRSDPAKTNHLIGKSGLIKLAPHFAWEEYFRVLGLKNFEKLNVTEPEFYSKLGSLVEHSDLGQIKTYLTWQLAHRAAPSVSPAFEKENFGFWNAYLHGEKRMKPVWMHCTQLAEGNLGYALAEAYVRTVDGAAIQARVETMIESIKQAFRDDLQDLTYGPNAWMDKATMDQALEKFKLLSQKVGAPKVWRNYGALSTNRSSFFENELKVSEFNSRHDLAKIGKPVDKNEWYMMPWEINAYYDPSNNEFVFPFGILQPPSFDLRASDGANLGAFGGGTIGHELTHGYDADGRKFDGYGNIKDWWTAATLKKFEERTQCYVNKADAFPIQVGETVLHVNGSATITENLADQGGVKLGYIALQTALHARAPAPLWLGQYTEKQQYWIAYAQSWCSKRTPEGLRVQITTNEHPPEEFRVNGVLMMRPEFARDFGCKAGDFMNPAERCSLW